MLELFYSSGLRLSELAGLDLVALDLSEGLVRVTGKGNKVRVVPVGRVAITALRDWLAVRASTLEPGALQTALFVGQQGNRLGVRAIQLRLKHYSLKQGMDEPVHPHMLRHAFASHMLESSGDLRAVQELLGHASISTTQIYTHLDFQHLAKVYDAAHPRAQRKSGAGIRMPRCSAGKQRAMHGWLPDTLRLVSNFQRQHLLNCACNCANRCQNSNTASAKFAVLLFSKHCNKQACRPMMRAFLPDKPLMFSGAHGNKSLFLTTPQPCCCSWHSTIR
jgi:hypothetical protein